MKFLIHPFIASLALLVAAGSAFAEAKPATLVSSDDDRNLIRLINFPETHGDANVKLLCQAIIKSNGRMNSPGCFIRNNWEPDFAAAVDKAAKKAEFQPATNNGKSRDVVLYYQVEFLKKNDDETINVYLHPAIQENIDEYGEDHIAAQRIVDKETWAKACPKRAGWVVTAKAHIDSSGVASSVDLEHNAGILPTGACQVALVQTIEGSGFVPAHDDGVAVPSSYYESFGN